MGHWVLPKANVIGSHLIYKHKPMADQKPKLSFGDPEMQTRMIFVTTPSHLISTRCIFSYSRWSKKGGELRRWTSKYHIYKLEALIGTSMSSFHMRRMTTKNYGNFYSMYTASQVQGTSGFNIIQSAHKRVRAQDFEIWCLILSQTSRRRQVNTCCPGRPLSVFWDIRFLD